MAQTTDLEGPHESVAKTALTLLEAGERVNFARNHTTSELGRDPDEEYELAHYDDYTLFKNAETGTVRARVGEDTRVYVWERN